MIPLEGNESRSSGPSPALDLLADGQIYVTDADDMSWRTALVSTEGLSTAVADHSDWQTTAVNRWKARGDD